MKKLLKIMGLSLLFCLTSTLIFSQSIDFENYTPLTAQGKLPEKFLVRALDDYIHRKASVDVNQKRYKKKAEEEFHLKSSYAMHDVFFGGTILYGDPLSEYINKVADEVLKNDPKLRKQLSFFVNRSGVVNAYCFPNGVILINVGMLTQLEDESQLALIIAHEITHYIDKHSLDLTLKKNEMSRGTGKYKDFSMDEMQLEYSVHSKEHELEADIQGLNLMKKTNYDISGAEDVFNILKYSYLPYDDISIDLKIFEPRSIDFPEDYYLPEDKVRAIDYGNEDENELSTHPSAEARKEAVLTELIDFDNSGRKKFIVGESEFQRIQKIARFDLSDIYLNIANYDKAIYNSYLNMIKYPEVKFNKMVIAKSLYVLSKYAQGGEKHKIKTDYKDIEGASQGLYYLTYKLDDEELCGIAISYILKLTQEYPESPILFTMLDDLIKDMVIKHEHDRSWFRDYVHPDEEKKEEVFITLTEEEIIELSKLEKIKYRQRLEEHEEKDKSTENFIQYALGNHRESDFIKSTFKKADEEKARLKEIEAAKEEGETDEKELLMVNSTGLGIKKIIILDPFHKNQFYTNKENYFEKNEVNSLKYNQVVKKIGGSLNMELSFLDDKSINSDGSDYNAFCNLKSLLQQDIFHFINEVKLVNIHPERSSKITTRYGANHTALMGVIGVNSSDKTVPGYTLAAGLINPLIGLYGFANLVAPSYRSTHFYILLDIEKGTIEGVQLQSINMKPSTSVVNSMVYDILYQTQKNPKK